MIRSKSNMRFQVLANFILILFTIFVGKYTDKKRIFIFPGKIQLGSLCLHMEKCV